MFERFALQEGPEDAEARRETLRTLLERHHGSIDRLVVRGDGPDLERWYEEAGAPIAAGIRVLVPRQGSASTQ